MDVAWFLFWGRFGCGVTPSVVDFLICVSVHTHNLSVLGAYKHTYIRKANNRKMITLIYH